MDILAVLKYCIAQGKLAANRHDRPGRLRVEICSANGTTLSFAVNGYTLSVAA